MSCLQRIGFHSLTFPAVTISTVRLQKEQETLKQRKDQEVEADQSNKEAGAVESEEEVDEVEEEVVEVVEDEEVEEDNLANMALSKTAGATSVATKNKVIRWEPLHQVGVYKGRSHRRVQFVIVVGSDFDVTDYVSYCTLFNILRRTTN